jgi:16S rRNA (guanine527-N7)-methyltransferase
MQSAGLAPLTGKGLEQFSAYGELIVRWNSRLNLTSIRDPEKILQRHFVESIFCAQKLPSGIHTLLDYGSGAGFPGIPIALCRPEIQVTLAESQGKKASFLREAIRTLGLDAEVFAARVDTLPGVRSFDAVAMRAVDDMAEAVEQGAIRVKPNGWLVMMVTSGTIPVPGQFKASEMALPESKKGVLILARRDCST